MSTTLNTGNRLHGIRITGKELTSEMVDAAEAVSLSLSRSAVTEMSFTFSDSLDGAVFRSGLFVQGATIWYNEWRLTIEDIDYAPGAVGPSLSVKAPSKYVTALKAQTGGKSWGISDVSGWVRGIAESVGMDSVVQPGLGSQMIARAAADGETKETTWDVLAALSKTTGVWLFEYGTTLVFARPSWLVSGKWANREWNVVYDGWDKYTEGLAGMPSYGNHGSSETRESLSFGLISDDADSIRPGDEVNVSGKAASSMSGKWIVEKVDFPLTVAAAVTVSAVRPTDPKIEPPRTEPAEKATGAAGPTPAAGAPTPAGASAVDRWVASVEGRAVDFDGAYGAQCVDLTAAYTRDCVGGPNVFGNGKDWFSSGAASGAYTQVPAGAAAQKGDIACWDGSWGGGYGHVAIVLADNGGSLATLSQNPGPARRMNLGKNGLMGYLRPRSFR